MSVEKINTLVVGAGQAGIAMSEHLGRMRVPHLVLERHRIAESWRSARWDSLVANGPAWHDRFPGMAFEDVPPDGFATKERVAAYFTRYAQALQAPVRTGVAVRRVRRLAGRPGFQVVTACGTIIEAMNVVAATGPFQKARIPDIVPSQARVTQLHSSAYKRPGQLADGAVLVVGGGASGSQIAEELRRAGRTVYLSMGRHQRPPRAYRGRDYCWWVGVLGQWDDTTVTPKKHGGTFVLSGYDGGRTVDFRRLAHKGITLAGVARSFDQGVMTFAPGLADDIAEGDRAYFDLLREADAYIAHNGLSFALEPTAWERLPDPDCLVNPLRRLDLEAAGVTTILWATGFTFDFSWLEVDAFDERGAPCHRRGVSAQNGIYFIGLPYLVNRASSAIPGVWHDAKFIAHHIALHNGHRSHGE